MSDRFINPTRRERGPSDLTLLFRAGSSVEVLIDHDGLRMRWRGEVIRAASAQTRSVEIRPFGLSTSIEPVLSQVVECLPYRHDGGSVAGRAIVRMQQQRRLP